MEIIMKTSALWLSALLVGASLTATGALAVDNVTSRDAPDLASVRAKIKAKDYKAAIAELTPMLETNQHADVYNLMGFSLRKTGDYKQAYTFYRKALDFDPEHKGALEYLGELYVETGQVDKARENVVLLKKLCPGGCEELAGRLLLAAIFLHEAWSKLTGYSAALAYMQAFGVPGQLLPLAIAVEVGCGVLILCGYHTRAAALLLAGFCLVTAVLFHSKFGDRNQLLHFEKDLAIAGGLLVLFAHGGGAWALDALRSSRRRREAGVGAREERVTI